MTSDMMVICKEDGSSYDNGGVGAVFICECSMGNPEDEFGEWFQDRFCGAPSVIKQMAGNKEHYYTKVTVSDVVAVHHALMSSWKMNTSTNKEELYKYIHGHAGKHISTENW